jgi:hypothetical protein
MFPGATRATSRDDSAEATDASHETNDHGAIPYYDHPYMCIVAPPPTAQNSPRAGALSQMPHRTSNPRPTNRRPNQQHAALAAAQTLAAIQERNPSTVPGNINPSNRTEVDISTEQQQVIVSKDHNHEKKLAAKRKLSELSEDNDNVEEEEQQPSTKRSCKDANDSSTGSSSNDEDSTYDNHDDDEEEITSDRTCNTDDMEEEDVCDDNDRDDDDDEFKDAVMEHERN